MQYVAASYFATVMLLIIVFIINYQLYKSLNAKEDKK